MNEIAKQCLSDKFITAVQVENLSQSEAARILGFNPSSTSHIKNSKWWKLVSEETWGILQKWCNSGLTIRKYTGDHTKISAITEVKPEIKLVEPIEEAKHSVNLAEIGWILGLWIKGNTTDQIAKELKIYPKIVEAIINSKTAVVPKPDDKIKPIEEFSQDDISLCNQFSRVWLEMTARELLVPFLKKSGYSGKLTKEIIF